MKNNKRTKVIINNNHVTAKKEVKVESDKCCGTESENGCCCMGHDFTFRFLLGIIIILVGFGLLLQNLFPAISFNYIWPLIIIVIGLYIIKKSK